MRQLLPALVLLSASTLLPALAHADSIDDFVLIGDGHTIRFSLPATGVAYISLNPPRLSDTYTPPPTSATVDGIGGYTGGGSFRFYTVQFPGAYLGFSNPDLNRSFTYDLYAGQSLIGFSNTFASNPCGDVYTYNCGTINSANVFFHLGSFDLDTIVFNSGPGPGYTRTNFTLTITPETPTSVTPEPATLTLLATGALGLLTTLRRRLN